MFRVQFGGDSKEQMLEHCCGCVQKLAEYVPVQVTDEQSLSQLANRENQAKDTEPNASVPHTVSKREHIDRKLEEESLNVRSLNDKFYF